MYWVLQKNKLTIFFLTKKCLFRHVNAIKIFVEKEKVIGMNEMKKFHGISSFDIVNLKLSTRGELETKSLLDLKLYRQELEEAWQDQLNFSIEINKYNSELVSFYLPQIMENIQKYLLIKDTDLEELISRIQELEHLIHDSKKIIQGWLKK